MLKAYAFDVDANLVFTDDTIRIDTRQDGKRTPTQISQKEDAKLSESGAYKEKKMYRYLNDNIEDAMQNFRGTGKFEQAIFHALAQPNNTGKWPSWEKFIEANTYASPIAIITARGHPREDIKTTHKKIILDVLSSHQQEDFLDSIKERLGNYTQSDEFYIQTYLNNNYYAPCSDQKFLASIHKTLEDSMPERKNAAFEAFIQHSKRIFTQYFSPEYLASRKIRIGFSDDTEKNITGIHNFIHQENHGIRRKYPDVRFTIYDTSDNMSPAIKITYKNPIDT